MNSPEKSSLQEFDYNYEELSYKDEDRLSQIDITNKVTNDICKREQKIVAKIDTLPGEYQLANFGSRKVK